MDVRRDCLRFAQHSMMCGYVQDKVRPGTGREGALGYERYTAGAGRAGAVPLSFVRCLSQDKVRPGTGREAGLGQANLPNMQQQIPPFIRPNNPTGLDPDRRGGFR